MKKILTLAVALVMVFALAAPALAAGWDNPVTPDEFENLSLNLTALSVEESSSVWNGGTYNKLDKTYPVVAGMKVHAYAEIKIPAAGDLSEDVRTRIQAGQGEITISISNLTGATLNVRNKDGLVIKKDPISSSKTYPINGADLGTTITVEIWGSAENLTRMQRSLRPLAFTTSLTITTSSVSMLRTARNMLSSLTGKPILLRSTTIPTPVWSSRPTPTISWNPPAFCSTALLTL